MYVTLRSLPSATLSAPASNFVYQLFRNASLVTFGNSLRSPLPPVFDIVKNISWLEIVMGKLGNYLLRFSINKKKKFMELLHRHRVATQHTQLQTNANNRSVIFHLSIS